MTNRTIRVLFSIVALCLAPVAAVNGADLGATSAPAIPGEQLTDTHVRAAIDAIVEALYERKRARSFWDPRPWKPSRDGSKYQGGGYTALVVHALLQAGESYQTPELRDAVDHLAELEMEGVYAISLRTSIWARLPDKFRANLETDAQWLIDAFSERSGGWTYTSKPQSIARDNSVTQFGALALWDAARRGIDVDPELWRALEERFLTMQHESGGWDYDGDGSVTGSMTTAGLATLFITQDMLHAQDAARLGNSTETPAMAAIRRGLAWMDEHFSPTENPQSFRDYYYYAWGVERVGLAGGAKHFGGTDWYRAMAARIIDNLCAWDAESQRMTVHERVRGRGNAATISVRHLAFSLMFLSRGAVPVAINKLHVAEYPWNNRPRDAANVARWLTESTEGEVSWQVVDFDTPPEEWLDAPVLYLASHRPIPWLDALPDDPDTLGAARLERDRAQARGDADDAVDPIAPLPVPLRNLKRYIDLGGLLLAVGEGNSRAFGASIEAFGAVMYPRYSWRRLPKDHWAYTMHGQPIRNRPPLKGLSNGVRELIILSAAGDLPGSLQVGRPHPVTADARPTRRRGRGFNGRSRGRLRQRTAKPGHFESVANVFFYASELNRPHARLDRWNAPARTPDDGRPVTVVRAVYDGNWDPEPEALSRFIDSLDDPALAIRVRTHALRTIHELEPVPALVIISGTDAHAFTEDERQAMRAHAQRGGMMLLETTGGTGHFTEAAEPMAETLFGQSLRTVLQHPIVTGKGVGGADDVSTVEYRPYSFEVFGAREVRPRLRGIEVGGDVRVLFSREDIGHGLLDQPCWGINGYRSGSARRLLTNIVRYAALTKPPDRDQD